jgi:AbrB family looped-hinge helix DNA binding protein
MYVTSKGQVTIPLAIRQSLGLLPHTQVDFIREGNRVYLHKVKGKMKRGRSIIDQLRGTATVKMSTEEIMALTRGKEE